jgi:hypothetical protein
MSAERPPSFKGCLEYIRKAAWAIDRMTSQLLESDFGAPALPASGSRGSI